VSGDWLDAAIEMARRAGVSASRGEQLARHTTLRVGGPADLLAVAGDVPTLVALVRSARTAAIPLTILGRGSNVVVADAGVRGLVVLARAGGCLIEGDRLTAEAGLPLARAATLAAEAGLAGLEFGLAIPGTVGGAVWANAGAHGSDVANVLESVTLLRTDGTEAAEPAASLSLGYRDSRLKPPAGAAATGGDLVLTATFRLTAAAPAAVKARLDEIRRWRQEHQPLNKPSAGSFFRNPPGDSAGRLIDACGLKGTRLGGAAISERHANFIVNEGGATASEIRRLAETARRAVAGRFGVGLEYEVQFIGDWSGWTPEE
jgi:UDP-N-acetylmuramate dehydrogenase